MNWIEELQTAGLLPKKEQIKKRPSMEDKFPPMKGKFSLQVFDVKSGKLVDEKFGQNVITNNGRDAMAHLWAGSSALTTQHIQIGVGDGATHLFDLGSSGGTSILNTSVVTVFDAGVTIPKGMDAAGGLIAYAGYCWLPSSFTGIDFVVGDGISFTAAPPTAGHQLTANVVTDVFNSHDWSIVSMAFGQGSGTLAVTDTSLFDPAPMPNSIITKPATAIFTGPQEVTFTGNIAANEGNGSGTQNYTEVGLVTGSDALASHLTFDTVVKSSSLFFTGQYVVGF